MRKLFNKSEIWFALAFIIIYVVGHSITDGLSQSIGIAKSITFVFDVILFVVIICFIKKNSLNNYYGLNKPKEKAEKYLFYIPLLILSFFNLIFGIKMNMPIVDSLFYAGSMLFVGFLEEIIFRGFLFNAMKKDGLKSAIIISSITFGFGHLIQLINGSGEELIPTICQALSAICIGYMFVMLLLKGKSLIPCIVTHSLIDVTSTFSNNTFAQQHIIVLSIFIGLLALTYGIYLSKRIYNKNNLTAKLT